MLNYIIRRLLLMIPTLFGITVMVFAIARYAPGRPGMSAVEGGAQDAEGQKKMREWFEKRYGLDLPLHMQYIRWWDGMIFSTPQARAWTSNFQPIYTLRNFVPDRYVFDAETGEWSVVTAMEVGDELIRQSSPAFDGVVANPENLPIPLLAADPVYPDPGHVVATVASKPIESLPVSLLEPAVVERRIEVQAPAWSRDGSPVYIHPLDPDPTAPTRLLFERNEDEWFELTPDGDPATWVVYSQDDPAFEAMVRRSERRKLAEVVDGRPLPRHVEVRGRGTPRLLEGEEFDRTTLSRYMLTTSATLEAWLWTQHGDPVFVAKDPQEPKLFQDENGNWFRLFGRNRVTTPEFRTYRQSDTRFLSNLSESQIEELPKTEGTIEQRHIVMEGEVEPYGEAPSERERRLYSHEIKVMNFPLGYSETWRSDVRSVLLSRLPITLYINLIAFPIIYIIAIPVGMVMALKRGRGFDASANVVMLALWSIPTVLTATLAIGYLAQGGKGLQWFPTGGLTSTYYASLDFPGKMLDRVWHLALPVACIVYGGFAYLAKQMRASMLDNFTMDYVRTALAKGVPRSKIVLVHVLRNSLIPIITIFATILPALIAGSVIIERIFNIEGMGMMAFIGVTNRDYDVVQALALIFGVLNLLSLLIADIVYAIVDPRIAYK